MKLYAEPASTTSRPIILFAAEAGIDLEIIHVNLFQGEHLTPEFAAINPNRAVPVLEDEGFRLSEASAILKYLAETSGSCAYPAEPRARARVHQWMDWFVTLFSQDFCYGVVYHRVLPEYALPEPAQIERRAFHAPRAARRLAVLDAELAQGGPFLGGDEPCIADHLGACYATLGELIGFDFTPWPQVRRWIAAMKARPAWDRTHAAFYGWRGAVEAQMRGAA